MGTDRHHPYPQSRGGRDKGNIVYWWRSFHDSYHTLFDNLLLNEVHTMLDILALSDTPWKSHEIDQLRCWLRRDVGLPILPLPENTETREVGPGLCSRVEFRRNTYSEAFRVVFRGLGLEKRHRLLDIISVPGAKWPEREIKRIQNALLKESSKPICQQLRTGWNRFDVRRLRIAMQAKSIRERRRLKKILQEAA